MKKENTVVVCLVAGLCLIAGMVLVRLKTSHHLGNPGVVVAEGKLFDPDGEVVATNMVPLPEVEGYKSELLPVSSRELGMLPKDTVYGRRRYTAADKRWTDLNVVLMGTDRTSIHKPQICLTSQGWTIVKTEVQAVPMAAPVAYQLPVMKLTAVKKFKAPDGNIYDARAVYAYWFVCENRITPRHGERMFWLAKDLLFTGTLPRWAYISYMGVCAPGEEEVTFERMKRLMSASVPRFQVPSVIGQAPEVVRTAAARE